MSFFMSSDSVIVIMTYDIMLILSFKMKIKVKENRNKKIIENN